MRQILKNHFFTLDKDKNIVPCSDTIEWAKWTEESYKNKEHWAQETIYKGVRVSTIFLGINHRFGEGEPILFETMIFGLGGELSEYQVRACTFADAVWQHEIAMQIVRKLKWHELQKGYFLNEIEALKTKWYRFKRKLQPKLKTKK